MKIKDEPEEMFDFGDITPKHFQDEKTGPPIFKFYMILKSEKSSADAYLILITKYARSSFRDFEKYLRKVIGLDEDDIQLILKQNNSNFVKHQITPGVYSVKDTSESVYTMGDHKGTLRIEYDNNSMKTKLVLSPFAMLRFNEISFLNTLSGFTSFWDYKPTKTIHADSRGVYTSEKNFKLISIQKIHLKSDVINGSVVNGIQEPMLFSILLDKPHGYKVSSEPETIHFLKKVNPF